jgi:hypothetical protein
MGRGGFAGHLSHREKGRAPRFVIYASIAVIARSGETKQSSDATRLDCFALLATTVITIHMFGTTAARFRQDTGIPGYRVPFRANAPRAYPGMTCKGRK